MKMFLFHFFKIVSFLVKFFGHDTYMKVIVKAYRIKGVNITGMPNHIDLSAHLDPSGGLTISKGVGVSVNAIILTHDWSFLRRYGARNLKMPKTSKEFDSQAFRPVFIDEHSLVGAGAIVLPGSKIGKFCLIGSGAVIKGVVEDYSIMIGNPARKIGDTRDPKYRLYLE